MPLTIKRTNPVAAGNNNFQFARRTSTAVGNSVLFNGSTQYLSVPGSAAFAFGTGSFTTEWWQYMTSQPSNPRVFSIGNYPSATIGVSIEGGTFYVWENSGVRFSYSLTADGYLNRWLHFAISRNNGTTSIFKNGIQIGASYPDTNNINNTSTTLSIGQESTPTANSYFPGYISNFRILNGTALYTASFTVPTAPLTAIANTSLLTCNAATIFDSSTNNFTITNNNGATVSSVVPFNAIGYGYKFKNTSNVASVLAGTQKAIFGYGSTGTNTAITNLVSNTGVVATDTAGVGTARYHLAAAGYGNDKAIFGYGVVTTYSSLTNLVSNTGVVATDTTGVGTARAYLAAAGYGIDKAIFGYGADNSNAFSITNKVSNTGVVATDTSGVGTGRYWPAAAGYGIDKAIFGYGSSGGFVSMTNKVSNTGVVATDTTGVGSARYNLAAAGYGTDKALFGYGDANGVAVSMTNKVSNTGIVATDTTGVGTSRHQLAAAGYGSDKAIFGYGYTSVVLSMTNLVSNTGVVSTDTTGVGTSRSVLAAAGFSITTVPAPSGLKFKKVFADPITVYLTQKAIFGYGNNGSNLSMTNLVSNTGVVATDTTGVGTARGYLAAASYGNDKAVFGYGDNGVGTYYSMTNLVSNTGVVASDTTGVGTARSYLAAAGYGSDKSIFGYGYTSAAVSMTNLISNTGVVSTDTTGVGTVRNNLAAAGYGTNKAIFGYGSTTGGLGGNVSVTNLVSNTGVVATDTTGVGTARLALAASGYGTDKAIFGYGQQSGGYSSMTNLVSNTGVVATDTTGVGTVRQGLAAAGYGSDKAIFGYGIGAGAVLSMSNLVSNTGVVATDTAGVGTARQYPKAAGYSLT